jgi:hypothetical protein
MMTQSSLLKGKCFREQDYLSDAALQLVRKIEDEVTVHDV